MEAVCEATIKTCLIELRQSRFMKALHGHEPFALRRVNVATESMVA